jgi:hypothetical protein
MRWWGATELGLLGVPADIEALRGSTVGGAASVMDDSWAVSEGWLAGGRRRRRRRTPSHREEEVDVGRSDTVGGKRRW